ncbi:hypothetical protein [Actinosynnema sp. NPDC020468]
MLGITFCDNGFPLAIGLRRGLVGWRRHADIVRSPHVTGNSGTPRG